MGLLAGALAEGLAGAPRRGGRDAATPRLYAGRAELDPSAPLGATPLRDGVAVSLGSPRGGGGRRNTDRSGPDQRVGLRAGLGAAAAGAGGAGREEPVGVVEVRITGGPGAGVVHRLLPGEYGVGGDPAGGVMLADPSAPARAFTLRAGVDGGFTITPAVIPGSAAAGGRRRGGEGGGGADGGDETGRAVRVDGACVGTAVEVPPGGPGVMVRVGRTRLLVAAPQPPDVALRPAPDGSGLEVNRPPRLVRGAPRSRHRLPAMPAEPRRAPAPVAVMVLSTLAVVATALVLRTYYLLLFAALAPLTQLGSHLSSRRHDVRAHRRALDEHWRARAEVERAAVEALARERAAGRATYPDPAALLLRAAGPRRGLWERRPGDPDFLDLRVGTADLPSQVVLEDPTAPEHRRETALRIADHPVTVPLGRLGVVGVAAGTAVGEAGDGVADSDLTRVLGCWLVAQAAVLHSPSDLTIYLFTDSSAAQSWRWMRWLPHCRPPGGPVGAVLVGADEPTRLRWAAELAGVVAARRKHRAAVPAAPALSADHGLTSGGRAGAGGPGAEAPRAEAAGTGGAGDGDDGRAILVVLDGMAAHRLPGMRRVLRDGPPVGVSVLCLEREAALLPAECRAVVQAAPNGLRVAVDGADTLDGVQPDFDPVTARAAEDLAAAGALAGRSRTARSTTPVGSRATAGSTAAWCERLARGLAPLRDAGGQEERPRGAPSRVRLLDLLGPEPLTAASIARRWVIGQGGTDFPLGSGANGTVHLDLRRDGPHVLVAGTTGAGKSELLQSMVAALAVRNRPDEMVFVLVDYKGGSAFADCADLPHTVGLVTDLDGHLVRRALESLGAELRRREALLAAAGAKDIDDYLRRAPGGADRTARMRRPAAADGRSQPAAGPEVLPRLVLVVDEFAALARELPEFVSGLVAVAGRGRSLGIHLVLATQRPAGVVSPEIRANTNLRIALRVTDPAESTDVVGVPDAAGIPATRPGRALVRVGQASPVPLQVARVGGPRRPACPAGENGAAGENRSARRTAGRAVGRNAGRTSSAIRDNQAVRPPLAVPLPWPRPAELPIHLPGGPAGEPSAGPADDPRTRVPPRSSGDPGGARTGAGREWRDGSPPVRRTGPLRPRGNGPTCGSWSALSGRRPRHAASLLRTGPGSRRCPTG